MILMSRPASGRANPSTTPARPLMRISCLVLAALTLARPTLAAEPPRLVAAWASGPMEARAAFDRAVDPGVVGSVVGRGIAFDAGRPGSPRAASIRVAAARLVEGGRTLVLVTDPHPRESKYRLKLAGVKGAGEAGPGAGVELAYDLGGVEVTWTAEGAAKAGWSGWWPGADPAEARRILAGSAEHDRLWPLLEGSGALTLRSLVALPAGMATVGVESNSAFEAAFGSESAKSAEGEGGSNRASLKVESTGDAAEFSVALTTGPKGGPRLRATAAAMGQAARALSRADFVLPWAPATPSPAAESEVPAGLLVGGDPRAGEVVFRGEQAKCATCHAVGGQGGAVGPELSGLAGRDRAWVYRNIVEPSSEIHPEFVSYTVALKDGRVAMGVVRAEGADAIKVGDIDAKFTVIPRAEVEEIRPSASSIMPVGLLGAIGEDRARDLLAYLTDPARKGGAAASAKSN